MPPEKPPVERPAKLKYFKLQYANSEYPILAFLYAVVCGGEHQLYCDFTEEFEKQYMIGRVNDPEFAEQKARLRAVLDALEKRRKPPAMHSWPTDAEWDVICDVIKKELIRGNYPMFVW